MLFSHHDLVPSVKLAMQVKTAELALCLCEMNIWYVVSCILFMSLIFLTRCWISHNCFRVRRPPMSQCLQCCHHAILHQKKSWWMVFPAKPTASQEASPTITPCSPAAPTKYSMLYRMLCQVLRFYQLPNSSTCSYLFLCTPFSSFHFHLVNKHLSHLIWCTPLSLANSRCWSKPWLPCQAAHNGFGERARSCCYPYVSHLL